MKVSVIGHGHLADATAECCQRCTDIQLTDTLGADIVWFCVDMPVDDNDIPQPAGVEVELGHVLDKTEPGTPVLISTQLPVGTTRRWAEKWPDHLLLYQPENIRKRTAMDDFRHQERMIIGCEGPHLPPDETFVADELLEHFTDTVLWVEYEAAEMTKHALNAWLAMNIVFANEIRDICLLVGADLADVLMGFRSDRRVNNLAPLLPGDPITGGTLLRDVQVLREELRGGDRLIDAIWYSNKEMLGR